MIKNIVFSGGGVKGFAYIGVYKALKELGIWDGIDNICTASVGSLVSFAFILGFTYEELVTIGNEVFNLDVLKSKKKMDIFEIYNKFGFESGEGIIKLVDFLIEKRSGIKCATFTDLKQMCPGKNLIVAVTNISKNEVEYLSVDNSPNLEISKAIRMSISIPLIFEKVQHNGDYYIDGAFSVSIPVEYFKKNIEQTLIISLDSLKYYTDITSIQDYLMRIWVFSSSEMDRYYREIYKDNMVNLIVDNDACDFGIDSVRKEELYTLGYIQFYKLLKCTRFKHYLEIKKTLDSIINSIIE